MESGCGQVGIGDWSISPFLSLSVSTVVAVYITVHSKVLLFENVDRGHAGLVCYQSSLLAHIGGRIAKTWCAHSY